MALTAERRKRDRQEILEDACRTGNPFYVAWTIYMFYWTDLLFPTT